jgi:hypothetical protein
MGSFPFYKYVGCPGSIRDFCPECGAEWPLFQGREVPNISFFVGIAAICYETGKEIVSLMLSITKPAELSLTGTIFICLL